MRAPLRHKRKMHRQTPSIHHHFSLHLPRPRLRQIPLVIATRSRKGEDLDDIRAAHRVKVDAQPCVVVVPQIEFIPPRVVVFEVFEKGIVRLRCGCPVVQAGTEGVKGECCGGEEAEVLVLGGWIAHGEPAVVGVRRGRAAVCGEVFGALCGAGVWGQFGGAPGLGSVEGDFAGVGPIGEVGAHGVVDPGEGWVVDYVGGDGEVVRVLDEAGCDGADGVIFYEDLDMVGEY